MHISKIIIEGFKSYKYRTELELDRGVNVVCGKNGSGKSNIYEAILFVVSDAYANLRRDVRQKLLHEGTAGNLDSAPGIAAAYVELVFDNSDGRFPLDRTEISIRRVIGSKKDEFLLNNKHVTRTEVDSLLESAGFSKLNPYNIVRQGKVSSLVKLKPSERLELCSEIAGTKLYEARRLESLNILKDANSKRDRIEEIVCDLKESLKILSEEKDELANYQLLDRERRALEYTIYDAELRETTEKLQELDDKRVETVGSSSSFHKEFVRIQDNLMELEVSIGELTKEIEALEKERARARSKVEFSVKRLTSVSCLTQDVNSKIVEADSSFRHAENQLKQIEIDLKEKHLNLANIEPEYNNISEALHRASQELRSNEQRINELYAKQARQSKFKNVEERNVFLMKQISERESTLEELVKNKKKLESDLAALNSNLNNLNLEMSDKSMRITDLQSEYDSLSSLETTLNDERNHLMDKRKQCWKKSKDLEDAVVGIQREYHDCRRFIYNTLNRDLRRGLETVDRFIEQGSLKGVHGPLIRLLRNYDGFEKFYKCVETTAGNRLFHVVVDNDDVGAELLNFLKHEGAGRVTLMPLNRLRAQNIEYPKSRDGFPMIDRLRFDEKFRLAFMQVFGKTLIVRDIQIGSTFSKKYNLDTITLDGDQCSRRGALTGGFIDSRISRLGSYNRLVELEQELEDLKKEINLSRADSSSLDQELTQKMNQLSRNSGDRRHFRREISRIQEDIITLQNQKRILCESLNQKSGSIREQIQEIELAEQSLNMIQKEYDSPFQVALSSEELHELETTRKRAVEVNQLVVNLTKQHSKLESEMAMLKSVIEESLVPTRQALEKEISSTHKDDLLEELKVLSAQEQDAQNTVDEIQNSLKELENGIEERTQELRDAQKELDSLKNEETHLRGKIGSEAKSFDKLLNLRSLLLQKKEKCLNSIRDLGSIPSELLQKFKSYSVDRLMSELKNCTEGLKKYMHVNRKAIEQFAVSTDLQDELEKKVIQVDSGKSVRFMVLFPTVLILTLLFCYRL